MSDWVKSVVARSRPRVADCIISIAPAITPVARQANVDQTTRDAGTITALIIRMQEYRLPRATRMLEKVKSGEILSEEDISFLERVYEDSRNIQPLVKRHPEYHDLVVRAIDLYTEIINEGVANEKGG